MIRFLNRLTSGLDPEPRLELRDEVIRRAPPRRSFWKATADRFGAIPMVFVFIFISIGAVALAVEFIFALSRLAT